jgi:signal transduction histidine kinase
MGIPQASSFGPYATIIWVIMLSFAIFRYRLFDIKVIASETLVVVIGIILFIHIFLADIFYMVIVNVVVFLLYCFFGYLLIRSILQEIKLREQLEAANKELKRLDEAKTEFLSIASHQLRTPLTAIKGYLGMIEEGIYGEVPEKVKEVLHKVNDSNERLIRLVNSLLDISRLELGRMQFDIEKVDIEEMLENIIDEFHVAARKKGLKLVFEHPKEKLPEVKIDPLKMRQVFLNLVDNAIKYTYQGEVIVKAELKDHGRERIRISVSDTGMGIARKEINEIFKIYRRGTGVRLFPEGSGVGLYVAKKLIEAHKGRIWAESKGKGRGSTFYVEIPVKK